MAATKQVVMWRELGRALKALRVQRSLRQKEVTAASGEEIGERTFRGYERGEQRPPRDRLLRFLLRCFKLDNTAEINGYLQLARYAALNDAEVREFGINVSVGQSAAIPVCGPPAGFRLEGSALVVENAHGREIWRHQFPARFAAGVYDPQQAARRCTFADIDGDSKVETLFVYAPLDVGSVGTTLYCFSEDGKLLWEFVPGKFMREDTGREYSPPYFISNVQVVPIPESPPRILVSSNHYLHNPNQIAMLDGDGVLISDYWHSGHLLYVVHADINDDGVEEILLAGVNNGHGRATMVIFDSRNVRGVSRQPGRQLLGCEAGTEMAVVLFPRTCLAANAPYNRVSELRVTRERRIMLAVVEGVSEARNPGVMIYELDFDLNVLNARPDSHLQEAHRVLEVEGTLDHPWTEAETASLRRQVTVYHPSLPPPA